MLLNSCVWAISNFLLQFKHENDYFIRGDESQLKNIARRKQVKRALESDER